MMRNHLTLLATLLASVLSQSLLLGDDLFRMVQPDATLCVHVRGLTENIARLERSEFASRLKESPFLEELTEPKKLVELTAVKGALEAVLQRPLRESVEGLFGRELVVAVYAVPGSEPEFVLITQADDPRLIESALTAWQALDTLETTEVDHRGVTVRKLAKPENGSGKQAFVAVFDSALVITQNIDRMRSVIDLRQDDAAESIEDVEAFAAALAARPQTEVAAAYFNPRVLDSAVDYFTTASEAAGQSVRNAWSRCQWITLRLVFDSSGETPDDLRLELIADYDSQGAPDWWQSGLDVAAKHSLPLDRVPSNAVLSASGQFSSDALRTLILSNLPDDERERDDLRKVRRVGQGLLLGLDPLDDLLPVLGPNWLAYCVPRDSGQADDFPVDAIVSLELKADTPPNDDASEPTLSAALDNTLSTGLNLLVAEHNSRTSGRVAVVHRKTTDDAIIRWAEPVSRFRPAFAISRRHLLIATTPELCERFLGTSRSTQSKAIAKTPGDPTQYSMVSSKVARQILDSNRDWFLWQARRDRVSDDEAQRRLDELNSVLKLADRAEFSTSLTDEQIRLTLSVSAESR